MAVTSRLRVALIAEESAGVRALRVVLDSGHDVAAVFAAGSSDGAGHLVAAAAARAGLRVHSPGAVTTAQAGELLLDLQIDLLLNVHGLHIVHPEVLAAPRLGAFNLHPGPLPQYAGLNAPSWAILNGEEHHGVTLHWMAPAIDAGPVAYAAAFPLAARETGLSASLACVRNGIPLLTRLLTAAAHDPETIPAVPQDETAPRRLHGRASPYRGQLPWSEPCRRIEALVRAADYRPFPSPWGSPRTWLGDRELKVLRAAATRVPSVEAPGTVVEVGRSAALVASADLCVAVEQVEVDREVIDAARLLRVGHVLEDVAG